MTLETYLAYLGVIAVFFGSPPGPSHLLMIANSLAHGVRPSLATMAGDLSANALQMTAAGFGLAALVASSAEALTVVKWAGVGYLVWMGIARIRRAGRAGRQTPAGTPRPAVLYRQGFLTSAANPKAVVFFAALFPQFIDPALPIWPQVAILGVTYLAVDGAMLVGWGVLATRSLRRVKALTGPMLDRISGALFIGAAVLLAGKDLAVEGRR
ncbi:homoserine/homoserine lactone efflux protein [Paralimibaculum aggregatum]|uniref:Homoserine/homoserine lactone efflux protein n=1 Tax=Paralimibaculum aggregatum TaxID=3036245 RepID=A0ABQ6LJF4_9RHOB|nr:LysE family transporter [Limibaculum sp. NKW23]GMG82314.1 homoserine/homoserine lactone efflux protein [Limibaculum sp. NKW23]